MILRVGRSLLTLPIVSVLWVVSASAQQSGSPQPPPASSNASVAPASKPPAAAFAADPSPAAEALELFRSGKYDEAAAAYNKIIGSSADVIIGYAGLARVDIAQHKVADALAAAKKAVELDPKSPDAHVALGEAYFRQGKIDQAENEFIGVVNSGAKNPQSFMDLARTYRAASYFGMAKRMISGAHHIDPDDREIHDAWWRTLTREEKIKALAADNIEIDESDPDDRAKLIKALSLVEGQQEQSCHLVSKVTSTEMKLEPLLESATTLRALALVVKVNGVPAKLELDTGSGGILINRKMGEKAGLAKVVETEFPGIGDQPAMKGYVGVADSIRIGDLEFQNCPVGVSDRKSIVEDDGLIGADVFAQFLIDINFPDRKFALSELPKNPQEAAAPLSLEAGEPETNEWHDPYIAPEMKTFTRVFRFGHTLLIPVRLNNTPPRLFVVDTGAFDNTITPEAAKEITKLHLNPDITIRGLNGKVEKVYTADHVDIQFSHFRQNRNDLIAFDMSHISNSIGTEVSGSLGFAMLWMLDIKIDYRDGLVNFTYDPNRFH